ncbi:MAG TPA: hypothetical protein DEP53_09750, partial [Bacteroidetes bacterium]|nr:hypothetical protein [Bacteroidota bacterium]
MKTLVTSFQVRIFGLFLLMIAAGGTLVGQSVNVTIPNASALPGATLTIPVNVGDLTGLNVTAFEFEVVCDSTIIRFTGVESSGTLSQGLGPVANYFVAPRSAGRMKVTCASATPISGSGVLIYL